MNFIERIIAGTLNLVVLSVLLVSSCTIPGIAYVKSPWWSLREVGAELPITFFVALRTDNNERPEIKVVRFDTKNLKNTDVQYHLPDGQYVYNWGPSGGSATVDVKREQNGSEVIHVFVTGNTPWSSLSEYRVINNEIHPLRHSQSIAWLLLGIPILLILFNRLRKSIEKIIQRLLVGGKPSDSQSTTLKNSKTTNSSGWK